MATLDFDALTLADIEDLEDYTGKTLQEITQEMQSAAERAVMPRGRLLTVLAWMLKRQDAPTMTLDQARQMPFSEATRLLQSLGGNGDGAAAEAGDGSDGSRPSVAPTA